MNELRQALREYLAARRALGFELEWNEVVLRDFLSFLEDRGISVITTKLALEWAMLPVHAQPAQWTRRLGIVHRFAEYRSAADPRTEIPAHGLLPYRRRRRDAYIYGEEEIVRLMEAAKHLPSKRGLRTWTHATVLGLMAVTGMRPCEVVALDRADVDLAEGVLTIRWTKFGKSRLVPVHPSTQRRLQQYARQRDRVHPRPDTPGFFLSDRGARLSYWSVHKTFMKLSRQIGLRGPTDRRGPRLHDLRHRFAVQTLANWYREGADVERRLPSLSVYLGHASVVCTYWYLTATPELLRLAAGRLDHAEGGLPS